NQDDKLYDDNPIDKSDNDILGRKPKAIQIARLLKNNKTKSSTAIGIVGKWGDGKSSFMNLIEENLKNDNKFITVQFNSWLNISVKSIIQDFFNTVEKEVAPYSFDISKEIKKYGSKVLSVNKNTTTETILNAVNLIPENSLSDDFDRLNRLLNRLNKKVIVFFDDLDRLQPNEVFEVLKLIRNTASFDVFNYIVGYDKEYINEALKNNQIPNPEKYCEKIFLKEFPLAPITQKDINKYIQTRIAEFLPAKQDEIKEVFSDISLHLNYYQGNIFDSIKNIRNAKRYLSELRVSIEGIENEVDLKDFMLVKLLKFSYYEVYRLLFDKQQFIDNRGNEGYNGNERFNSYKLRQKEKDKNSLPFSIGKSFNSSILKEEIEKIGIYNTTEIETIGIICSKIFKDNYRNKDTTSLSLAYGQNYYKYFNDEIDDTNFLKGDFSIFITSDFSKMVRIVDKAKSEDKLRALMQFIYKLNITEDLSIKSQYENFVKILFYIANLDSDGRQRYFGVDHDFLYNTTNNYNNRIVSKFGYGSEEELKVFLQSIFYQEKKYYDFEPNYLKSIYDYHGTSDSLKIPFTKDGIIEYLIFCFNHNNKLIESIDSVFWDCYKLCFIKDWIKANSNSYSGYTKFIEPNKEKFLFEVIPQYLDDYLVHIVTPQDWYGEEKNNFKVGISNNSPIGLFGSIQGLINYLESDKLKQKLSEYPSEFITEFLSFAKEVEIKKDLIDFNFAYPPMKQKLKKSIRSYD
uniref:KAP family P-loop NTPase fold protein n=1 Tax=Chryseobacterium sp. TaxID=1871047 RepID=UPI003219E676